MNEKTAKDSHYARLRRQHRDREGGRQAESRARARNKPQFAGETPPEGVIWLYGFHAVEAALLNPRRVLRRLLASKNAQDRLLKNLRESGNAAAAERIEAELTEPRALEKLLGSQAVHQGIALETEPLRPRKSEDFADSALVLVLDQVTDPHNVGAIMRSAVAFNADSFITTRRHSPQETGVLAKSASGALEKIDHISVGNLAEALERLNAAGFQTVGLDSAGEKPLEESFAGGKIALVLGAEGKGLRQRTRETVSVMARLDMPGAIKSLNVSNAAAIALYAARRHLRG